MNYERSLTAIRIRIDGVPLRCTCRTVWNHCSVDWSVCPSRGWRFGRRLFKRFSFTGERDRESKNLSLQLHEQSVVVVGTNTSVGHIVMMFYIFFAHRRGCEVPPRTVWCNNIILFDSFFSLGTTFIPISVLFIRMQAARRLGFHVFVCCRVAMLCEFIFLYIMYLL